VSDRSDSAPGVPPPGGASGGDETGRPRVRRDVFAALDLGTNNCRLLIAKPDGGSFRVIDAFSRTVRLGEGLAGTGRLSEDAILRTIAALKVCAGKIRRSGAAYVRAIATEACRAAANAPDLIARIRADTGIRFDIIAPAEEAKFCAAGCAPLADPHTEDVLVFDIGGGSTELIWMKRAPARPEVRPRLASFVSVPLGVVTLAERFGAGRIMARTYPVMEAAADAAVNQALSSSGFRGPVDSESFHLLGTSGTVTTLAGIQLDLPRYDRSRIDGIWLDTAETEAIIDRLVSQEFEGRASHPCVGPDRADLVLPGCAIFIAILRRWRSARMRVADRGLREGVLLALMAKAEKDRRYRRGPRP
jgi:exopolyphosphatase / guanosine-5'-triphosphate,3'-diphosphate pyrophosphatase